MFILRQQLSFWAQSQSRLMYSTTKKKMTKIENQMTKTENQMTKMMKRRATVTTTRFCLCVSRAIVL